MTQYAWAPVTAPRMAQRMGSNGWRKQLGCASCGAGQLGQLEPLPPGGVEAECPPGWPEGFPCVLPAPGGAPSIPIITEEEAANREVAAYEKGRREEQGSVIKTAAISAAVSAVVGIAIGKFLG